MQGLQESGWAIGAIPRASKDAAELVALAPEVILGGVGATAAVLQQASRGSRS
jgi:hypothetical protein